MLRLAFRFLGLLALAIAFAALIVDGTRSIAAGSAAIMPLGRTASMLFPAIFVETRTWIESHAPVVWDPVLVTLLLLPAWLVIGLTGIILIVTTRRKRPKIGYSRR